MAPYPLFLSLVCVLRNQAGRQREFAVELTDAVAGLVSDYELIIVDNASDDDSLAGLRALTRDDSLSNLQVFALTKQVDNDTACWAGVENALGDFVLVIDPLCDDIHFLPHMLARAAEGSDVVFAVNTRTPERSLPYRLAQWCFNEGYRRLGGVNLSREAPRYRLLSRRIVNFILQHPRPSVTYRHLPATGGFSKARLSYSAEPRSPQDEPLLRKVERGMRLLVSTTRAPMRLVTLLSLFGAVANVLYSLYVVAIAMFKADVAPGWVSLSLQQSGMFFLLSLVLLVLGEYMLNVASLSNEGPAYHIGQEFTSTRMTRHGKLNVEELQFPAPEGPAAKAA